MLLRDSEPQSFQFFPPDPVIGIMNADPDPGTFKVK